MMIRIAVRNWRTRSIGAGVHLLGSLAVFIAFISILYWFWYPRPYFSAAGGGQGLRLVVFVDLVLGPLLTFVVFNKGKAARLLIQDLTLIVLLQLAALCWGIYIVYQQRPLAIVFWESSFYTVPYRALARYYADTALFAELKERPRQLLYAEKPQDKAGLEEMLARTERLSLPPHHQLEYYRPLSAFFRLLTRYALDIDEIVQHNPAMHRQLMQILAVTGGEMHQYIYLPLQSRYRNIVLVFDKEGDPVGSLQAPYKQDE